MTRICRCLFFFLRIIWRGRWAVALFAELSGRRRLLTASEFRVCFTAVVTWRHRRRRWAAVARRHHRFKAAADLWWINWRIVDEMAVKSCTGRWWTVTRGRWTPTAVTNNKTGGDNCSKWPLLIYIPRPHLHIDDFGYKWLIGPWLSIAEKWNLINWNSPEHLKLSSFAYSFSSVSSSPAQLI